MATQTPIHYFPQHGSGHTYCGAKVVADTNWTRNPARTDCRACSARIDDDFRQKAVHYIDPAGAPVCGAHLIPAAAGRDMTTNPKRATCSACHAALMSPGRTVQITFTVEQVNRMADWLTDAISDDRVFGELVDAAGAELRDILQAAVGAPAGPEQRGRCRFTWGSIGSPSNECALALGHSGAHQTADGSASCLNAAQR